MTAGGTATAWHISEIVREFFNEYIELYVCDTNDSNLVPSSINAVKVFKVPFFNDANYEKVMESIIEDNRIDIVIPLIPQESIILASDSMLIKNLNVLSSAPKLKTVEALADKLNLFNALVYLNIPTPKVIQKEDIIDNDVYIVKPRYGFGSRDVFIKTGRDLKNVVVDENSIIQEYCGKDSDDEVTVEVFNDNNIIKVCARKRIETKAGVCTKTEFIDTEPFENYVKTLCSKIEMPTCFNLQFIKHNNVWKLFDCNLRLAAGTPLSTAAGFQLTRALICKLIGLEVPRDILVINKNIKSVLRVYKEIVIK